MAERTPELVVTPGPSVRVAALLCAAHGWAVLAAACVELDPAHRLLLGAVLAGSLARATLDQALRRSRYSVVRIRVAANGCTLERAGAHPVHGALVAGTVVWRHLAILAVREPGRRRIHRVLVWCDALPSDDFRRLRVWLRWAPYRRRHRVEAL